MLAHVFKTQRIVSVCAALVLKLITRFVIVRLLLSIIFSLNILELYLVLKATSCYVVRLSAKRQYWFCHACLVDIIRVGYFCQFICYFYD